MNRLFILAAGLVLWAGSTASAQVSVRAPFVRVEVGPGGTYVRAPFVRYYSGPPLYVTPGVVAPPGITIAPPVTVPQVIQGEPPAAAPAQGPAAAPAPAMPRKMPNGAAGAQPAPEFGPNLGAAALPPPVFAKPPVNNADFVPPPPAKATQQMTIEAFAKSFQAREGSYEVALVNPVTKMPMTVRFTLPPGQPDVAVGPASITYRYVGRSMVKIEFDADGATVTSR